MVSTKLRVRELLRERRWTTKVLAEKTGMSESYLTHLKNGTRRWNEDALRKLSIAFDMEPVELFEHRRSVADASASVATSTDPIQPHMKVRLIPVIADIPSKPSEYLNQQTQASPNDFAPAFECDDPQAFCYLVPDDAMAPVFTAGDQLVISPGAWIRSGDVVAVEYGSPERLIKAVVRVNFMEEFVVLDWVNHKKAPVALVRGKDMFRIIGKVLYRYQKMA